MVTISRLARLFGLSRSTLLYYDRIGLLCPTGRSEANYRLYCSADRERLEAICSFRQAGLTIEDIRKILASESEDSDAVQQQRLRELGAKIRELQAQQRLLAEMLKVEATGGPVAGLDKETWVEMLRAAGMDDDALRRWHREFERRAPKAHHGFLLSLGIQEKETLLIRKWSLNMEMNPSVAGD